MKSTTPNLLGVTIAFSLGAVAGFGLLYGLDAMGLGGDLTRGVDDWLAQAVAIIGIAAVAGAMVDLLRFVGTSVWPGKSGLWSGFGRFMHRNLT